MGNFGWGVNNEKLKFQSVDKHDAINRNHLKYFDSTKPSKFNGGPAGFNEHVPEKPLIDLDPDIYRNLYPHES